MAVNLQVVNPISNSPAAVVDANNNKCGLSLATAETLIHGKDLVGQTLPLIVVTDVAGLKMGSTTWGRVVRLQSNGDKTWFWDIGIDQAGNLFLNAGDKRVMTIAQPGQAGNVNES